MENERASIMELLEQYEQVSAALPERAQRRAELDSEVRVLQERLITQQKTLRSANEELARFAKGTCPTCNTPVGAGAVDEHLADFKLKAKTAEVSIKKLDAEIIKASKKRDVVLAEINEQKAIIADEREWRQKERNLSASITTQKARADIVQRLEREAQEITKMISTETSGRKKLEAELKALDEKLGGFNDEMAYYDFWLKGFGNTGLGSYLLDTVAGDLTTYTNDWLSVLSDGYLAVEYDTQDVTKKGTVKDRLNLSIFVDDKEVTPSGGELRKIGICTRLALASIDRDRGEPGLDLLLLDEILDYLDPAGKERVELLLLELRQQWGSILVITHEEGMTEVFENDIAIIKEGGVSFIEETQLEAA